MSVIQILYDGVDITTNVVITDTNFTGQVNGVPGQGHVRVRDLGHDYAFTTGKEVLLKIDFATFWGGYVMRVLRTYAFDVDDSSDPNTTERFWILECNDYNVLFQKRVAYKLSNPDQVTPFMEYPANTQDIVVLEDILTNYFDIVSDGIDISTGLTNVGTVGDAPFQAGSVSHQLGQIIQTVARETGAVFYIDPAKILRYVDAEAVIDPLPYSDNPTQPANAIDNLDFGYRALEIITDGSNLINDMYEWGAGLGSNQLIFSHVRDAASVELHGLWQHGELTAGLYHQNKVDRRANSFVYGTPQSKRGHKDDAVTWIITTFLPYLQLGSVVPLSAFAFNTGTHDIRPPFDNAGSPGPLEINLPVRRIEISFISPTELELRATLTYEIDLPWSFFEFPPFPLPGVPVIPPFDIPGPPRPSPSSCRHFDDFSNRNTCSVICYDLDDFNRVDQSLNGSYAIGGGQWTVLGGGAYIINNKAVVYPRSTTMLFGPVTPSSPFTISLKFTIESLVDSFVDHALVVYCAPNGATEGNSFARLVFNTQGPEEMGPPPISYIRAERFIPGFAPVVNDTPVTWATGVEYLLTVVSTQNTTTVTVAGVGTASVSLDLGNGGTYIPPIQIVYDSQLSGSESSGVLTLDDISLAGYQFCVSGDSGTFGDASSSADGSPRPWYDPLPGDS